jgi:glycosyltransferase involved in cell wall biosynthesis
VSKPSEAAGGGVDFRRRSTAEATARSDDRGRPEISVVVPFYNEEANAAPVYAELTAALQDLGLEYELIFVDDGSSDRTFDHLRTICDQDPRVQVLRFSRNYGQTAAIQAGFEQAAGRTVVTMDGDLQNDPADIERLMARLAEGYDVVAGWRRERKDSLVTRRIPSMAANWLIRRLVGTDIHDNGCALKAYRREIVDKTDLYSDMHRFLVPMLSLSGGRITELVVNHRPRRAGSSKYGVSRIWKVVLDLAALKMLLRFSSHPAVWFAILGTPFALLGIGAALASFYLYAAAGDYPIVAISISLITTFVAIHLVLFGMIAELVVRLGDFRETASLLLRIREKERRA